MNQRAIVIDTVLCPKCGSTLSTVVEGAMGTMRLYELQRPRRVTCPNATLTDAPCTWEGIVQFARPVS